MRYLTSAVLAAAMAISASAALAQCDDGETVIKFSHVTNADNHPKGLAAALFATRVNEEMNGKVCVEVYPNSTLYGDDKELEALLNNDVQMIAPSVSKFEQFTKKFRMFDFPFLFKNIAAVDAYQASEDGQALKDSMVRRGVQGLQFWHSGMKQFSANKPLILPTDAKGLKFRVQSSDVLVAMIEALEASPQKMAFSEVYGALQTGVVDGQENTWSNIRGQKFYEVQDGVTHTDHGVLDYLVAVNAQWWQGLPDDQREQLATIMAEVTTERNAEVNNLESAARKSLEDQGVVVRELDDTQRQAWVDAMKPVWDKFSEDVDQATIDAVQAINTGL
jgi:C4-dicarboxylate-binding protein DctP